LSKQKTIPQSFKVTTWEYVKVVGSALLIAFVIRSFLFEPFKIPSGSMVPTLLIGDYLFVNKYTYGLRVPFTDIFLTHGEPKRGDVVVFKRHHERMGSTNFIKRIVAVPGDKIAYLNKKLYVNDTPAELTEDGHYLYKDSRKQDNQGKLYQENLLGVYHYTLLEENRIGADVSPVVVPKDKYIVMGDNRDNSLDSRFWSYPNWGFLDKTAIVGRAEVIFWSWDHRFRPRFDRITNSLRIQNEPL
jgi:signal peptidase I